MTFRDDHDAALARVDALDAELERTKAERDRATGERDDLREQVERLERERAELQAQLAKHAPKPRSKAPAAPARDAQAARPSALRQRMVSILPWVVAGGIGITVFAVGMCRHGKTVATYAAWQQRVRDAEQHKQRWKSLIRLEPCVRQTLLAAAGPIARRHPDVFDPVKQIDPGGWALRSLTSNCLDPAKGLVADKQSEAWKGPLREWLAVEEKLAGPAKRLEAYESNADWREDQGAARRQLWQDAMTVIDERRAILGKIRQQVFPEVRAELRGLQQRHEAQKGRDETWWRMELGLGLWAINEISLEKAGIYAGRWFDEAAAAPHLRQPVATWVEAGKQAPIEVRRELRKLEWITTPLIEGRPLRGETPLWHLAHPESDVLQDLLHDGIPAIPDPGPEPPEPSSD